MKIEFLTKNHNIDYEFQNVAHNQVWNVMSKCEGFDKIYWHEIFPIFIRCVSHVTDLEFPKYIHSQEHIQQYFLDFGFDFNHLDGGGNSFLKYYLSTNRRDRDFKKLILTHNSQKLIDIFSNLMREDIFYHKNNFGETILFDLLHPADTGLHGEHFKEVLDKYPKFKEHLHDKNKNNFNLLNKALNESNLFVIPFFLEEQLDFTHKFIYQNYGNNQKPVFDKNILEQFIFLAPRDEALNFFNLFIQHVDIMEKAPVKTMRDNFFHTCLDWSISDKVHQETRNKSCKWLRVVSKNIINEKAFIGKNTLQQIHDTLHDYIFKHMHEIDNKTALSLINLFTYTEHALDLHKNKRTSVKMKI